MPYALQGIYLNCPVFPQVNYRVLALADREGLIEWIEESFALSVRWLSAPLCLHMYMKRVLVIRLQPSHWDSTLPLGSRRSWSSSGRRRGGTTPSWPSSGSTTATTRVRQVPNPHNPNQPDATSPKLHPEPSCHNLTQPFTRKVTRTRRIRVGAVYLALP